MTVVDPGEAVLLVLREADEPLHWTVIQDRALKRGYLDPFVQGDVRREVLAALADGVRTGLLVRTEAKGVYTLAEL